MDEASIKAIEKEAYRLGFNGFGVAPASGGKATVRFQEWLNMGFEGEMEYMVRGSEKRLDLQKVLPGIKSVICLRTNYLTVEKNFEFLQDTLQGDIALYALNEDYHYIIETRLRALEEKVHREFPSCRTKIYVDTGPILEKPLAQRAGLGWIGKHTNLITEGKGSWNFLSEILVDVSLPESIESIDRCGTCSECIKICPTQAIVEPYVLDSRKCISYLNIELKGVIPFEYRKAIGSRIFGCDDCQIVCPWNFYAEVTYEKAFQERLTTRHLIDLIMLNDESFRKQFRKSPINRIKRRGFLRNVAVALGNSGDPKAVTPLVSVLKDKEPLIRAHAVWALGELLREQSMSVFYEHLTEETEEIVLDEIRRIKDRY